MRFRTIYFKFFILFTISSCSLDNNDTNAIKNTKVDIINDIIVDTGVCILIQMEKRY